MSQIILERDKVIKQLQSILLTFSRKLDMHSAYLCGSVARNQHEYNSDIDVILILYTIPISESILVDLKIEMEIEFDKEIDLIITQYSSNRICRPGNAILRNETSIIKDIIPIICRKGGCFPVDILFSKLITKLID